MPDPSVWASDEDRVAAALAKIKQERPDLANLQASMEGPLGTAVSGLQRVFSLGKGMTPVANTSSLTGQVMVPQGAMSLSQPQLEDVLTHEGRHYLQQQQAFQGDPWYMHPLTALKTVGEALSKYSPKYWYGGDPAELEGYQDEADRAVAQRRTPMPHPAVERRDEWQKGDIYLPEQTAMMAKPRGQQ